MLSPDEFSSLLRGDWYGYEQAAVARARRARKDRVTAVLFWFVLLAAMAAVAPAAVQRLVSRGGRPEAPQILKTPVLPVLSYGEAAVRELRWFCARPAGRYGSDAEARCQAFRTADRAMSEWRADRDAEDIGDLWSAMGLLTLTGRTPGFRPFPQEPHPADRTPSAEPRRR